MTAEEVAEAYGEAILAGVREMSETVPSDQMIQVCLSLQAAMGALVGKEPIAPRVTRLVTELGDYARQAHKSATEHRKKAAEEVQRQTEEILNRGKAV